MASDDGSTRDMARVRVVMSRSLHHGKAEELGLGELREIGARDFAAECGKKYEVGTLTRERGFE